MKGKYVLAIMCVMVVTSISPADTIRGISMDFVPIGHAGNAADTPAHSGSPTGCGAVNYNYRIGKYEVTNAQWNTFVSAAGAPTGNPADGYDQIATYTGAQQPTNRVSWYEAAQFCNYLTSGNKSLGAYQLNADCSIIVYRSAAIATYGTAYVIPTEDEWYKAAYYKSNGSGYSRFANGLNTIPTADNGWNYYGGAYNTPWNVGIGAVEQNGTFDMMGNVYEWNETVIDSIRGLRGGSFMYDGGGNAMAADGRNRIGPSNENEHCGFRIAEVPEPATLFLLGLGVTMLRRRKR